MHLQLKPLPGYKYGQKLGSGTYADVYKCTKIQTGQVFAVKVFKPAKYTMEKQALMIRKQIEIVRKLNHRNIIKCIDVFEDEKDKNRLYAAVFQLCGKGNLQEYVHFQMQQKNRIPEEIAKTFIHKILSALMELHNQKIAHRDLKLANILINDDCEIKLADFGLSKQFGEEDMLKTMCGTPLTMAPQILSRQLYTEKCDTWSFGVISYYLLFFDYPFNGRNQDQLLKNILTLKTPKFPNNIQISDEGKDFLKACLTIEIDKRPAIQELSTHKWFRVVQESRIRSQFMKTSFGEESELVTKFSTALNHAFNTQIYNLIMQMNLTENHIKSVSRGFDEFYPQEKLKHFKFYVTVGQKLKSLINGSISLHVQNQKFSIKCKHINALDSHVGHVSSTIKEKFKQLSECVKDLQAEDSYQQLVKFVVFQGNKLVEKEENNIKKIRFFKNLLEFINVQIVAPLIKISLHNKSQQNLGNQQQLDLYVFNILNEERIEKIVNGQDSKVTQNSSTVKEIEKEWKIEYENPLKVDKGNQVWKVVGEAVGGALRARESSARQEQNSAASNKPVKQNAMISAN